MYQCPPWSIIGRCWTLGQSLLATFPAPPRFYNRNYTRSPPLCPCTLQEKGSFCSEKPEALWVQIPSCQLLPAWSPVTSDLIFAPASSHHSLGTMLN